MGRTDMADKSRHRSGTLVCAILGRLSRLTSESCPRRYRYCTGLPGRMLAAAFADPRNEDRDGSASGGRLRDVL